MDSNPKANYRRRAVVIAEKRLNTEEGNNGDRDKMVMSNGKDIIHKVREESIIEKPKGSSYEKKNVNTPATISPMHRKTTSGYDRPKWHTILNVVTKNCLLLASLLWLSQFIWQWTEKIQNPANDAFVALEYEGRVSEVEAFSNRMSKMIKVQLEVLDKKIDNESGNVKNRLMKQNEDEWELLHKQLKGLYDKADSLEKSVNEVKDTDFISKEELEKLWGELKGGVRLEDNNQQLDLDYIRAYAGKVVENEMDKHVNDGIGRVDYAAGAGGAIVIEHSQPFGHFYARIFRRKVDANAHKILEPSFGEPGQCFALKGSSGYVQVRLITTIIPEAITLEHVPKSVAYDRSRAPKDGIVIGWLGDSKIDKSNPAAVHIIANISYSLEKSNVQTFHVLPGVVTPVNNILYKIESNHGNSAFTCIYRIRVHGREPSLPILKNMND